MTVNAAELRSGKGSGDENFPVASWLLAREHRRPILAFYEFVRIADDIADHPQLRPEEKLQYLDALERSLLGQDDGETAGVTLRAALAERNLSPQHAQDLLRAFRQDVTKLRYDDWDDLINYCRYSAMPVGRFVLDVHGESRTTWAASDNVCAVLQIINHLQDCVKDYRALDRVYVPLDALAAAGTNVEALDAPRATPQLLSCLHGLAGRTGALLEQGSNLPAQIDDTRLAAEISAIVTLARHFVKLLRSRDPLSENVRLGKFGVAAFGALGAAKVLFGRTLLGRTLSARSGPAPGAVSGSPADERRHTR
jgi:squalene synthase HpnC